MLTADLARYLASKAPSPLKAFSLTVARSRSEYFEIAVIPKTWEVTNFSHLKAGDEVNLEADIIAKYVERIMTVAQKPQT